MHATGRQMLSATLVELLLDQWRQHQDLGQQHRVQQQRRQVQEVLQTLQLVALVHCVEDPHQSR